MIVIGKQMSEKSQKQSHIKRPHYLLLRNTALQQFWLTQMFFLLCVVWGFFSSNKTFQKARQYIKKVSAGHITPGKIHITSLTKASSSRDLHNPPQALGEVTYFTQFKKSNFLTSNLNLSQCKLTCLFSCSQ